MVLEGLKRGSLDGVWRGRGTWRDSGVQLGGKRHQLCCRGGVGPMGAYSEANAQHWPAQPTQPYTSIILACDMPGDGTPKHLSAPTAQRIHRGAACRGHSRCLGRARERGHAQRGGANVVLCLRLLLLRLSTHSGHAPLCSRAARAPLARKLARVSEHTLGKSASSARARAPAGPLTAWAPTEAASVSGHTPE